MKYDPSDNSGTDDDLPPSHQNRSARGGHITGNGRVAVGFLPYTQVQNDIESEIHRLEQEAYSSVLRAFKAQSDAITWEKESLIAEIRKELRVSDEEHRELLSRVNADDIIRGIRDWRQAGGLQSSLLNNAQPVHDPALSPTTSASRKRQKTMIPSQSLGAPSPVLHSQPVAASLQPSSSGAEWGTTAGAKGKKPKPYPSTGPSGKGQVTNQSSSGVLAPTEHAEPAVYDPLIGRKVMMRWPEDNNFYKAVITDYNARKGLYALVYDMNTMNETWEWVNVKEIPPEDIRWEGEDPGISNRVGRGEHRPGTKKPMDCNGSIPVAGRGRGSSKKYSEDFSTAQNGIGKKASDDIEILHTQTLLNEVERVVGASHPDPLEIEKAKKLLKEHERSLIDAIVRLTDASDGESEEGKVMGPGVETHASL